MKQNSFMLISKIGYMLVVKGVGLDIMSFVWVRSS